MKNPKARHARKARIRQEEASRGAGREENAPQARSADEQAPSEATTILASQQESRMVDA